MFLLHCTHCDHEWQSFDKDEDCSWCGHEPYVLQETRTEDNWAKRIVKAMRQEATWRDHH
jgi:hypothetical protein